MKRWFSLFLVALFFVPVLAVGASASEVYIFEYMEMPAALSDSYDFIESDTLLVYDGILPPGVYDGSVDNGGINFTLKSPMVLSFDSHIEDFQFCTVPVVLVGAGMELNFDFTVFYNSGCTFVSMDGGFTPGSSVTVTRVGDLPSESGFDTLLGDVSSFTGSCISSVTKVADTITGSPLLLLTVGILFLGGCIGVTGRLFSRR